MSKTHVGKTIKLRKSDLDGTLFVTENWVTNGRWAVNKRALAPKLRPHFVTQENALAWAKRATKPTRTFNDEKIASTLAPDEDAKLYKRTPVIWAYTPTGCHDSDESTVRLFVAEDGSRWWASTEYVDLLGLTEVWSKGGNFKGTDVRDGTPDVVLMPVLGPEEDKLLHRFLKEKPETKEGK